jgi:signal transduction histidine kinase
LFGRAVSNLIENALRFTPDKGQIKVSTMRLNGAAEIIVEDNGSGISAEHLPRIFDRFYRADASRSSAGTGLGLSLVKSIVDLHRGKVSARSELGQGTVVALTFPDSPDGKKTR